MDKVAILDCGGQYTKVIDRRVRELGIYTAIFPGTEDPASLAGYSALILSGGPSSVYDEHSIKINPKIFGLGLPVLAICYGMQFLVHAFGGQIQRGKSGEYGVEALEILSPTGLFAGCKKHTMVLMSHFDVVASVGVSFEVIGKTSNSIGAVKHKELPLFGVQFHPEVDLTEEGQLFLKNFLFGVTKLLPEYTLDTRIDEAADKIRKTAMDSKVLVLVSGGVDSAVTLVLLHRTIPDKNIVAIHVDTGFMRKNESESIKEAFEKLGFKDLIVLQEKEYFLNTPIDEEGKHFRNIFHVLDPELRRRIIGKRFIEVAEKKLQLMNLDLKNVIVAQGTLRPDLIESGNPDVSKFAHTIKTHHNDVQLIRTLRTAGKVIETNAEWHKDEVRQVAKMLGLPDSIALRQPFPGPGLSIRMINSSEEGPVQALGEAGSGFQFYSTPLKAVGVQGDERSYRNVAILSSAGDIASFDWEAISRHARKFTNENTTFNRVIVPLTGSDASKLRVYSRTHDSDSVELLREVDDFYVKAIHGVKVSQSFVVLVPIGASKKLSVVVRAIITNDFMTGNAALPSTQFPTLVSIAASMKKMFPALEEIFYDVTNKPPATVEWL